MCGLSGIWNWYGDRAAGSAALIRMTRAQEHRGPDGHGYAIWSHAKPSGPPVIWRGPNTATPQDLTETVRLGLSHNWLAIQDTRPNAQLPLASKDGRYWIAFNGEIYNFIELREDLRCAGVVFETESDTEVLLALWQRMGAQSLPLLRGMFAFLLYDREADVLWAVRDRFGIKPLYYAVSAGERVLLLASEFRGIHASGLVPRKWSDAAVKAFLAAGVNNPAEAATFFEGVSEVPPGCLLEIRPGKLALRRYYQQAPIGDALRGPEALDELRDRFGEVISQHLRSTREVGTCMSGGLDSTNIANAIHRAIGDRVAAFKAFTIGRRDDADIALAALAAKGIGCQHHIYEPNAQLALADQVDMVVACETPNHTWGPINQYLLMRHIRDRHHIHVLLDGQGADEVFSGYPWFFPVLERYVAKRRGPDAAARFRAAHAHHVPHPQPALETLYRMFHSRRKWVEKIDGGAMSCLGLSIDEVLGSGPTNYYLNDDLDWSSFRQQEFYRRELQFLLRQEDRLGMWFSIECRVPFLDHTLVEWVGTLSPEFLVQDGYLKYPLRVLYPEVPEKVRFNAVKRGFWEDYARPSHFEFIARRAIRQSDELRPLIRRRGSIENLSHDALWRFFQMAVLLKAGTREEGREWAEILLRGIPPGLPALDYWYGRFRSRAKSAVRKLLASPLLAG